MEKYTEVIHNLEWTHVGQGKFKATVTNGKVSELSLCEIGAGAECEKCLTSVDETYLRALHTTLGELLKFIDEEQGKLGYSFADNKEKAA